jgi:hypothetical protein
MSIPCKGERSGPVIVLVRVLQLTAETYRTQAAYHKAGGR